VKARTRGLSGIPSGRTTGRPSLAGRLLTILELVETWLTRRRQRLDLAELDDRLLADIGLTRADVARETAKPFWQP
jgi:uncharacterized protein YjiS (DUF1127 family)